MIWRKAQPSVEPADKPKGFDDYDVRLGDLMRGERATMAKSLLDVQRDLKIKATYIAAIENADVEAFESPGFIAGYVRSYARYLGMDPEWAYGKFCEEAGFSVTTALGPIGSTQRPGPSRPRPAQGLDALADPNAVFVPRGESILTHIEPRALASVAVLIALIGGIGYGGWSVLREVQRVQVAPVEQAPNVAASIDPLGNVGTGRSLRVTEAQPPVAPTLEAIGQITRPQALEAPVLVPRDGPIAAINPRQPAAADSDVAQVLDAVQDTVRVLAEAAPEVEIFAVSPSWVRVRAADGTVLFEKILDAGESYVVPQSEVPPSLRAGNSGSVYFMVKGQAFGPAAPGAQVVSNIALSPETLTESFAAVDLDAAPAVARVVQLAQARHQGVSPQD